MRHPLNGLAYQCHKMELQIKSTESETRILRQSGRNVTTRAVSQNGRKAMNFPRNSYELYPRIAYALWNRVRGSISCLILLLLAS